MTLEGVFIAFMAAITAVVIMVAVGCIGVLIRFLADIFGP